MPWVSEGPDGDEKPKQKRPKKTKYTCPACRTKIWAETSDLNADCADCGERFLAPDELREELRDRREGEAD